VTFFQAPKITMQNTTFYQQITTTSPQKTSTKTPLLSKTPRKNATPP
jgi:hypothetical protein